MGLLANLKLVFIAKLLSNRHAQMKIWITVLILAVMLDFSAQARRTGTWMVDSDGKKYWIQSKEEARRTGKWMVDSDGKKYWIQSKEEDALNKPTQLKAIINDESKKIRGYRRGASSMIKNNK